MSNYIQPYQSKEREHKVRVEAVERRASLIDLSVLLIQAAIPEAAPLEPAKTIEPEHRAPAIPLNPNVVATNDPQALQAEQARRDLEEYWRNNNGVAA